MIYIIWVIQAILWSFWMILTKKVLLLRKIWNNRLTLNNRLIHLIILLPLIIFWALEYKIPTDFLTLKNIWILLVWASLINVTYVLRRHAYKYEKVSVLQPFAMLYQVFPVIIGFIFIASERLNIITFFMAIIASLVTILPSIDYKNFKFSIYSLEVLISSLIKSWVLFWVIYLITIISPTTFYVLESVYLILFSILFIFINWEYKQIKDYKINFFRVSFIANLTVVFSIILSLTMFKELWVIATSLISLLYLGFVYILWYFILKEIPSKKDIIITILVAICIMVWIWFKN